MKPIITAAVHIKGNNLEPSKKIAKELRRADSFIISAVAATHLVLEKNSLEDISPEETGLVVTTAFGPMQTNFDVLESILDNNQASPTLFSHSVYNGAAGYISRIFDIRGPAFTMTAFTNPFFHGLQQACILLSEAQIKRCLVLQVETYSRLLDDYRKNSLASTAQWPPGACAWLIEKKKSNRQVYTLDKLSIDTKHASAIEIINYEETLTVNDYQGKITEPMGALSFLTDILTIGRQNILDCRINGLFGTIDLLLQKNNDAS